MNGLLVDEAPKLLGDHGVVLVVPHEDEFEGDRAGSGSRRAGRDGGAVTLERRSAAEAIIADDDRRPHPGLAGNDDGRSSRSWVE